MLISQTLRRSAVAVAPDETVRAAAELSIDMSTHTTQDLSTARRRLEVARELLGHAGGPGTKQGTTGGLLGRPEHLADTASDTLEREAELSVVHGVEFELLEIAAAEARLAAGTYGRCEVCGAPLDEARLEAIPWATRCMADQEQAETLDEALRTDILHGPSEYEATEHSDLIPDEEAAEELDLSPEESAMHLSDGTDPGWPLLRS
jgi:DnaK suppressor protein